MVGHNLRSSQRMVGPRSARYPRLSSTTQLREPKQQPTTNHSSVDAAHRLALRYQVEMEQMLFFLPCAAKEGLLM